MKVRDLIAELQRLDQDTEVYTTDDGPNPFPLTTPPEYGWLQRDPDLGETWSPEGAPNSFRVVLI